LYEKELKGKNGCEIAIVDAEGNKKVVLASVLFCSNESIYWRGIGISKHPIF